MSLVQEPKNIADTKWSDWQRDAYDRFLPPKAGIKVRASLESPVVRTAVGLTSGFVACPPPPPALPTWLQDSHAVRHYLYFFWVCNDHVRAR